MEQRFIELVNTNIEKIESSLREDIKEIKADLKSLKDAHLEMSRLIAKLTTIEDRYNMQMNVCRDNRAIIDNLRGRIDDLQVRFIPIEEFFNNFKSIKNKVVATLIVSIIMGAFGVYIAVSSFMGKWR